MLSLAKKVVDFCGGDRELYQIVYTSYRKNYSDEPFKYSSLMPGAMSALNFFYNQNIPMGICTNKRQYVTEKLIQKMNLEKFFNVIVGARDNIPLKPNPDMVLLIAGKPWENDFAVYQEIIDKNNLAENIILHTKFILHKDVEYYYSASDLVVLPYKKIYQSGVLMMTLSYERPALASNLPPLKEVVIDNENGFLFKSEDINDLAKKLNFILSDKENLQRIQKNGSISINEKFNWDEIGRLTKKAYQTL